jgi:hypothetical protein
MTDKNPYFGFGCFLSNVPLTMTNGKWGEVFLKDDFGKVISLDLLFGKPIPFVLNVVPVAFYIELLDRNGEKDNKLLDKYSEHLRSKEKNIKQEIENRLIGLKGEELEKEIAKIYEEELDIDEDEFEKIILGESTNINEDQKQVIVEKGLLFKKSYSLGDRITQTKAIVGCKNNELEDEANTFSLGRVLEDFLDRKVEITLLWKDG